MKTIFGQTNQEARVEGMTKEMAYIDEVNFLSTSKSFKFLNIKYELFDYVSISDKKGKVFKGIIARIVPESEFMMILPTAEFIETTLRDVEPLVHALDFNNIRSIERNDDYELLLMIGKNHALLEKALNKVFDHERKSSRKV